MKTIDLVGTTFSRLTVLYKVDKNTKKTDAYWLCRCICGKEKVVASSHLRNEKIKSCGCLNKELAKDSVKKIQGNGFEDLTGNIYGRLRVISLNKKQKDAHWDCLCECGQATVVKSKSLNSGETRSCGCLQKDSSPKGDAHWNWKGGFTPINKRNSQEYKKWRKDILERDYFTCQNCGSKNKKLEVHHIKRFSKFEESRYDVDNGITLCKDCHKETEKY